MSNPLTRYYYPVARLMIILGVGLGIFLRYVQGQPVDTRIVLIYIGTGFVLEVLSFIVPRLFDRR